VSEKKSKSHHFTENTLSVSLDLSWLVELRRYLGIGAREEKENKTS
jgi:hypothetical protein